MEICKQDLNFNFLICSERSGSNLISQMIGSNTEVLSPPVAHFYRLLIPLRDMPLDDLKKIALKVFSSKLSKWCADDFTAQLTQIEDINSLQQIIEFFYMKEKSIVQKNISSFFIKEVRTYKFFPFLKNMYKNSKYVWLHRDPRDMALSWKKSGMHRGDVYRAANVWHQDQSGTWELFNSNKKDIYRVSYENLTLCPEVEIMKVFTFLGLKSGSISEYHYSQQAIDSSCWKNLNKPVMKNSQKFLTGLSKEEIFYIEELNKDLLVRLGYERVTDKEQFDFQEIELKLKNESRHEKEEHLKLTERERAKQYKWYEMYQSLPGIKF